MQVQIVAAPGRQFKTYSMWLGIVIGTINAVMLALITLGQVGWLSLNTALGVNAVLGALIVPAKLILQNIPATTDQKIDIVAMAAAQPMAAGESNVAVKINEAPIPTTPSSAG